MWVGVRQRFSRFHLDLKLTDDQVADGSTKQLGVRQCLHTAYYNLPSITPSGFVVGSWGKGTAIRPPSDVDVFFELPIAVYHRIEGNSGNKQSILLQEVRNHLQQTYPQTNMRGDGQVTGLIPILVDGLKVETRVDELIRLAATFKALQDRFRRVATITTLSDLDRAEETLAELMDQMDTARSSSITAPERYFIQAREKIRAGHYNFSVDEQQTNKT